MDYTLKSVRDAFESLEYKQSKTGFDVYALLLATSLDQQFVLEYLSFFHELHNLTGENMLVIGPRFEPPGRRRPKYQIGDSQLESIKDVVNHRNRSSEAYDSYKDERAGRFLLFMQDQTRESYDIARFIGLRTDAMPAMVFFESLDSPLEFVVWKLSGMTGEDFVRALRTLIEELRQRCHWGLQDRIQALEKSLAEENSSWDKPSELRNAESELYEAQRTLLFYERLHALRQAYDKAGDNPELRMPLENVGQTIASLESGIIDEVSFNHLKKHHRRWKTRMPSDYRAAVESLFYPHGCIKDNKMKMSLERATDRMRQLEDTVPKMRESYEAKRRQKFDGLRRQLSNAQELASSHRERPLDVISQFTSTATTNLAFNARSIGLRAISGLGQTAVPRVFISYSHDSERHKHSVYELAQRLRGDGVDCWIDQFESSPSQGFPRWMQVQIERSDFVLLVCTAAYRRRFDGLEEAGKGLGVNFEGHLILQELYDAATHNLKFIPIIFPDASQTDIPKVLRGSMWYQLPSEYESLYRRITNQPEVSPDPLGSLRVY